MSQDLKTMIKTTNYLHNPSLCKARTCSDQSGLLSRSQSLQLPGALPRWLRLPGPSAPLTLGGQGQLVILTSGLVEVLASEGKRQIIKTLCEVCNNYVNWFLLYCAQGILDNSINNKM